MHLRKNEFKYFITYTTIIFVEYVICIYPKSPAPYSFLSESEYLRGIVIGLRSSLPLLLPQVVLYLFMLSPLNIRPATAQVQ